MLSEAWGSVNLLRKLRAGRESLGSWVTPQALLGWREENGGAEGALRSCAEWPLHMSLVKRGRGCSCGSPTAPGI